GLEQGLVEATANALGRALGVRVYVDPLLQQTVREGLRLLREMAAATPPGVLLLAQEGDVFDPQLHEAARGCPQDARAFVEFPVFPGYRIDSPPGVLHKAEVVTMLTLPEEG